MEDNKLKTFRIGVTRTITVDGFIEINAYDAEKAKDLANDSISEDSEYLEDLLGDLAYDSVIEWGDPDIEVKLGIAREINV